MEAPRRPIPPPPAVLLAAAALAAVLAAGCDHAKPSPCSLLQPQEISREAAGDNLGVLRTSQGLYLTYPDLGALSLNLVRLDSSEPSDGAFDASGLRVMETTYLDRISETPEIGEGFGTAPLILWDGLLHVFYSDREREGTPVLKWISGPTADGKWWIDILPFSGEPLAVVPSGENGLDLYLLRGEALVRQSLLSGESEELLSSCDPALDVCTLGELGSRGITVFDRRSRRLYAFLQGEEGLRGQVIYTAGAVHHSILREGRMRVLLFSPQDSTLFLLEEEIVSGSRSFTVTPVTLCRGTTSVYLGYAGGRPFFLYNERSLEQDEAGSCQLTLLSPVQGEDGETRYRRTPLLDLDSPLRRFKVSADGDCLYVFFVQETLKMLSLDLRALSSE